MLIWLGFILWINDITEKVEPHWPLHAPPILSASFGEYRGNRFHMGIDLSTGGVEGKQVFPVADGTIFKVRSELKGYGNSVYIKHKNGWISVYGHLADFGPKIKAELNRRGLKKSRLFGDQELALPISGNELIAYSGESGSGLPHLHFEIRDASNQAMDPLLLGFPFNNLQKESLEIKALRLSPLTPDSQVNGSFFPVEVFDFSKPVQASGTFQVEVWGYIAFPNGNRLGLRALNIESDSRLIAEWRPEKIDYAKHKMAGGLYNRFYSGFSPTRYVYSFLGLDHPGVPGVLINENLNVEASCTLSIKAQGLTTSRSWQLVLDPIAPVQQLAGARYFKEPSKVGLWKGRVRYHSKMTDSMEIRSLQAGTRLPEEMLPDGVGLIARLPMDNRKAFALDSWQVSTSMQGQLVLEEHASPPLPNGLHQESTVLNFENPGVSMNTIDLFWNPQPGTPSLHQLGLYSWSFGKGKWLFEKEFNAGTPLFSVPFTSRFVILRDTEPPEIGSLKKHHYFIGEKRVIPVKDRQSGVDWQRTRLQKNGKNTFFEADQDRGWLILPDTLEAPFTVILYDRAGNQTGKTL